MHGNVSIGSSQSYQNQRTGEQSKHKWMIFCNVVAIFPLFKIDLKEYSKR